MKFNLCSPTCLSYINISAINQKQTQFFMVYITTIFPFGVPTVESSTNITSDRPSAPAISHDSPRRTPKALTLMYHSWAASADTFGLTCQAEISLGARRKIANWNISVGWILVQLVFNPSNILRCPTCWLLVFFLGTSTLQVPIMSLVKVPSHTVGMLVTQLFRRSLEVLGSLRQL